MRIKSQIILSNEIKASIAESELDIEGGRLVSHDKTMQHFKNMAKKASNLTKTSINELENILQFYIDRNKM